MLKETENTEHERLLESDSFTFFFFFFNLLESNEGFVATETCTSAMTSLLAFIPQALLPRHELGGSPVNVPPTAAAASTTRPLCRGFHSPCRGGIHHCSDGCGSRWNAGQSLMFHPGNFASLASISKAHTFFSPLYRCS